MNIHGKVVVITGASAGIGAAAARAFAAAGARVVLAARGEQQLRAVAEETGGLAVPTDVASRADTDALVERACEAFGGIDVLVNNAGVGIASPVGAIREEDMLAALRVNVLGPLALTQAALPALRARGGQVIFVSSVVGLRALPYLGGYAATKAALDRLTEALRVELRGSGVAVTLARPGTTSTGFAGSRLGGGHERRRMSSRAVPPEQVARALVRAAERRPRVVYAALGDRLNIAFSLLTPRLTDRLLGWAFQWEG